MPVFGVLVELQGVNPGAHVGIEGHAQAGVFVYALESTAMIGGDCRGYQVFGVHQVADLVGGSLVEWIEGEWKHQTRAARLPPKATPAVVSARCG